MDTVYSNKNGWALTPAAQNIKVLRLYNCEVAYWLAKNSNKNGWGSTEAAKNPEVLK